MNDLLVCSLQQKFPHHQQGLPDGSEEREKACMLLNTMSEPDLTELMYFTDDASTAVQEALWHGLMSLSAKAEPYRSSMFLMASFTEDEVEEFHYRYPGIETCVNQIIAGQEYPPPAGYRDTLPDLSRRLLPEWHGETCSCPGLFEHHFEVAKEVVLAQRPEMDVFECGQAAGGTCDYCPMRVRIYTTHKHIVSAVPSSD